MLRVWKKSWEPFRSCLPNSTANPAHFHPSLAGLAVLFGRQLPNGSYNFFQTFSIHFSNYFMKIPQTTIALPFLTHNVSAIGGVSCLKINKYYIIFVISTIQYIPNCFSYEKPGTLVAKYVFLLGNIQISFRNV